MKIKNCLYLLLTLCVSLSVQAINVGEITSIITSDSSSLAKEIINTTDSARFVSISVERISSPMAGGKIIPIQSKSELLFTPASLIMPGDAREHFRFIYGGKEDDKERYYRLTWTDEPVTEFNAIPGQKGGHATTSATISTILVVAPRKEHFSFNYQDGVVSNNGNTSFRVVAFGPCKDKGKNQKEGCRERYYVMPGNSVRMSNTDTEKNKTRIGIWHGGKYISVK
ncbi:EcpB family pilus assembly chaperone [Erwinia psidii]|uniref:Probable fimbrial chaperone EcpB n=1 Tax=Erwinia psidii TaxID=69224 RepID=A0A3N6RXD9_9GAMM|nr:hypothetical protein [Erwinia psidii]MCX8958057.1 hypothetical protein [Erwinia psidii]MCX8962458.1 hypothetical protein [Erwinia psidii]MCX8963868.1 hypothetical protein [Erwinia psidii]RQM37037.1 hypothetical protein EB241_16620 [Erwinia psidii]